jgi:hypothetical protein
MIPGITSLMGVLGDYGFDDCNPRSFGFSVVTATGPSDVYVADFGQASKTGEEFIVPTIQWTKSEVIQTLAIAKPMRSELKVRFNHLFYHFVGITKGHAGSCTS